MVVWKRGWAAFGSPRMANGRNCTTKAGDDEEGLEYFHRLESESEKKERTSVRSSKRLLVGDGGNLLVRLAGFRRFHVAWP